MTEEEKLMQQIFGEHTGTLYDNLPCGYSEKGMGRNDEVDALLNENILDYHTMSMDAEDCREDNPTWPKPWPGQEQNVFRWYELENGVAVGWIMSDPWKFIVYTGIAKPDNAPHLG